MRRLQRPPLSASAEAELDRLSAQVEGAADPKAKAQQLWDSHPSSAKAAFQEIRQVLRQMAPGIERCMYCEDSQGTDIEHFWPKGRYPAGAFCWENYLLACSFCNSNCKREDFPLNSSDLPLLLNPASIDPQDDPRHHLTFRHSTGHFNATGVKGQPSITTFDLNGARTGRRLPQGRLDAFGTLQDLTVAYARASQAGETAKAADIQGRMTRYPFSSVLLWLVETAEQPGARNVLDHDVVDAITRHNLRSWL